MGNIFRAVFLYDFHLMPDCATRAVITGEARNTMIIGGSIPHGSYTDNGIETEIIH